jgi:hypothetical protein
VEGITLLVVISATQLNDGLLLVPDPEPLMATFCHVGAARAVPVASSSARLLFLNEACIKATFN